MSAPLSEDDLQKLYAWVDQIPLSRPKKNIARDFSDGVLLAEVVSYYFPRLVDVHNYTAANSVSQKNYNWDTLNAKVLKRLKFALSREDIDAVVNCKPGAIERVLYDVQVKLAQYRLARRRTSSEGSTTSSTQNLSAIDDGLAGAEGASGARSEYGSSGDGGAQVIRELKETVIILEQKVAKLEQLVRIKDTKILRLQQKLKGASGADLGTTAALVS